MEEKPKIIWRTKTKKVVSWQIYLVTSLYLFLGFIIMILIAYAD